MQKRNDEVWGQSQTSITTDTARSQKKRYQPLFQRSLFQRSAIPKVHCANMHYCARVRFWFRVRVSDRVRFKVMVGVSGNGGLSE